MTGPACSARWIRRETPHPKTTQRKLRMTTRQSTAWSIWFIAALFYAVEFFQRVAPGVIAKPLAQTFHIDPGGLGFIIAFYFWAYAIAQIPVGIILDKYGARISLGLAALAVSIGTFLFAHTGSLIVLGLARILVGIGSAFAFVGCLKLAKSWFFPERFGLLVGLTNTLGVCGALFGQEPLTNMIHHIGWQRSLEVTAVIGFIVCALIFVVVRNNPREKHAMVDHEDKLPLAEHIVAIVRNPQSWLVGIYAGLMVAPVIAFAELWSVSFLQVDHHLTANLSAKVNQFIFIGIAVGGPLNGWIAGLLKRRKLVMGIGNVMALILLIAIIKTGISSVLRLQLIMFFFGFFTSSMLSCFPLNVDHHKPAISATVIAFTNMLIMIIGAVFQPLIGGILDMFIHSSDLLHYTPHEFQNAVIVLPIALAINLIILWFVKDPK